MPSSWPEAHQVRTEGPKRLLHILEFQMLFSFSSSFFKRIHCLQKFYPPCYACWCNMAAGQTPTYTHNCSEPEGQRLWIVTAGSNTKHISSSSLSVSCCKSKAFCKSHTCMIIKMLHCLFSLCRDLSNQEDTHLWVLSLVFISVVLV